MIQNNRQTLNTSQPEKRLKDKRYNKFMAFYYVSERR